MSTPITYGVGGFGAVDEDIGTSTPTEYGVGVFGVAKVVELLVVLEI
jgi:hypothetical protein